MKKCVIYARVSHAKGKEENVSIQSQVEHSRSLAAKLGAKVEQVFIDDGRSAWHGHRPAFEDAMDYCEAATIDFFIVWSTSRFSRNRIRAAMDKDRLAAAGVEVKYVSSPIDRATDEGWLLDGIYELFDEHQSRGISRDTKRSMIRNAKEGYWNGGTPPLGFRAQPSPENRKKKRLVVDDDEAALVRRIFTLRSEGHGGVTIARILNGEGSPNRGRKWNRVTVLSLLGNEAVIGNVVFNRTDRRTGRIRPRAEWVRVRCHPAIIDEDLWESVQVLKSAANPTTGRLCERSQHLFTGLLWCGICGSPMRTQSSHGDGGLYHYYQCAEVIANRSHPSNRIRADKLDLWLAGEIADRIFTRETIAGILNELREIVGNWARSQSARRAEIVKEMDQAQRKSGRIYELFELHGKDTPNLKDLTARLRQHRATIERCEQRLEDLDAESAPQLVPDDALVGEVVEFLADQIRAPRNPRKVRAFFSEFLSRVEVGAGRVSLRYIPERLIPSKDPSVRSKAIWLPGRATPRTEMAERCVAMEMPAWGRRAGVARLTL